MDEKKKTRIAEIGAEYVDTLKARMVCSEQYRPPKDHARGLARMIEAFAGSLFRLECGLPFSEVADDWLMFLPFDLCGSGLDIDGLGLEAERQVTYVLDIGNEVDHMRRRILDCIRMLAVEGQGAHRTPLPVDLLSRVFIVGLMLAVLGDLEMKNGKENV